MSRLIYCPALCLLLVHSSVYAQGASDLVEAWAAREKMAFHYEWDEEIYHFRNSRVLRRSGAEFALDGSGRCRYAIDSLNEPMGKQAREHAFDGLIESRQLLVYDGLEAVILFTQAGRKYQNAFAGHGASMRIGDLVGPDMRIIALRLFYRPFIEHRAPGQDAFGVLLKERLRRTDQLSAFDGITCRLYEDGLSQVWVTEDVQRLPLRLYKSTEENAPPFLNVELSYEFDSDPITLAGWKMTDLGVDFKTIIESRTAKVTQRSVGQSLNRALFRLEKLPHGTLVTEGEEAYVVRDGQPNRKVLSGELTANNREYLINSEPPTLSNEKKEAAGSGVWLWIGNGVLLVAIAGIWYWRSRSTRGNFPDPPNPGA